MLKDTSLSTDTLLSQRNSLSAGLSYFVRGMGLLTQSGMKRYVLVPILANVAVFFVLTAMLIQYFSSVTDWFNGLLSFWSWLAYLATFIATLLSGVIFFTILLIYGYSFNIITNIIAAPFYGLLAEKIEARLNGAVFPSESFSSMAARTLKREVVKLWYFTTRGIAVAIGLFLLAFIPFVNLSVPFLALLWGAWVMTLQYVDYPADNNKLAFTEVRQRLKKCSYSTTGLGSTIMLGSMIPVVNIFVMPIAVAAGTLYWDNELRTTRSTSLP
ncbi:MAG: sulfate transporter CysZ [Cellvibrionaceae bacterium]